MSDNYWTRAYKVRKELGLCAQNDYNPGSMDQPEWCWRRSVAPSRYCWQHSGKIERDEIRALKEAPTNG